MRTHAHTHTHTLTLSHTHTHTHTTGAQGTRDRRCLRSEEFGAKEDHKRRHTDPTYATAGRVMSNVVDGGSMAPV